MANSTPMITTIRNIDGREKTPKETDTAPQASIQELCEKHYDDILPIILEKASQDKRKGLQSRLDFRDTPKRARRIKSDSLSLVLENSPAKVLPREEKNQKPDARRKDFEDKSVELVQNQKPLAVVEESIWAITILPKERQEIQLPNNDHHGGATRVWFDELLAESIDRYKDLKEAFLSYFMQQKKYVKDPVEIHNIKQKEGETIEEFIERFKTETGRMKGAPECM
ncbi:reverse transcriptase domain-containing protein [Tanacetum coccineum]